MVQHNIFKCSIYINNGKLLILASIPRYILPVQPTGGPFTLPAGVTETLALSLIIFIQTHINGHLAKSPNLVNI